MSPYVSVTAPAPVFVIHWFRGAPRVDPTHWKKQFVMVAETATAELNWTHAFKTVPVSAVLEV